MKQARISSDVEKTVEYYDKLADGYSKILRPWRIELLEKYFTGRHKTVLEIGCGTGNYLAAINVDKKIGIDISKKSLQIAKKRKGLKTARLIHGFAEDLPIKSNSVDFVFSYSALYNMPDQRKVINEIKRVLRSGGVAVLEFQNMYSPVSMHSKLLFDVPQYFMSEREINKVLKEEGFDVIDIQHRQIIPGYLAPNDFRVELPLLKNICLKLIYVVRNK